MLTGARTTSESERRKTSSSDEGKAQGEGKMVDPLIQLVRRGLEGGK